ncbi:MAG: hypothetical protein IJQ08_08660 [Synergistaceae bacterium]|nr:hypothetical protein [Synergistaceae bacterium]
MPLIINPIYAGGGGASKKDIAYLHEQVANINEELQTISEALVGTGKMKYKGAYIAGDEDMDALIDDVFNGDGSDGETLSEIPDELKDEITTQEDFNDMLSEIFG